MPKRKSIITKLQINKPSNYWLLGTRYADDEPVLLGTFKEGATKPLQCTRQHIEAVASAWASKPDPDKDQPLYSEVLVIQAVTDGHGNWQDPLHFEQQHLLTVVRPGHFQVFGKESQESEYTRIREKVLGCKGREWQEAGQ